LTLGEWSGLTTSVTETTGRRATSEAEGERPHRPTPFGSGTEIPTRVLVLGMVRKNGTLHAADVYPVAEACGQSVEQVRSCLRRLVGEQLFDRQGEGRDATYQATPDGLRVMAASMARTRLAFAQDAAGRGWDRRWHVVAFAIPEARRSARDAFRDHLLDLGGAPIQNGMYVSPHPWEKAAQGTADRLGVREHVTLMSTDDLEIGDTTDPKAIAARLWPLDAIGDRYLGFVETYRDVPPMLERWRKEKRRLTEAEFLPGSLAMGIDFQNCFNDDPLLPPELLPRPWPGRQARELLISCRRLGVLLREAHDAPQLFAPWDDLLLTFKS
jgi:phenylacetic acid degradation operon negative regulatory protein